MTNEILKIVPGIQSLGVVTQAYKGIKNPSPKKLSKNFADITLGIQFTKLTSGMI